MTDKNAWLQAALSALRDPTEEIKCPEDDNESLIVFDVVISEDRVSRYLLCPKTLAKNIIELSGKDALDRRITRVTIRVDEKNNYSMDEIISMDINAKLLSKYYHGK